MICRKADKYHVLKPSELYKKKPKDPHVQSRWIKIQGLPQMLWCAAARCERLAKNIN